MPLSSCRSVAWSRCSKKVLPRRLASRCSSGAARSATMEVCSVLASNNDMKASLLISGSISRASTVWAGSVGAWLGSSTPNARGCEAHRPRIASSSMTPVSRRRWSIGLTALTPSVCRCRHAL
eukprot:scaffold94267_cov32-Tisochrysis_lutea.AAC.3